MRPTREDVQAALDKLVQRQRIRIVRDDDKSEYQMIPSLWEQLVASASWNGGGSGAVNSPYFSRPVISTGVVSLCHQIQETAVRAAREFTAESAAVKLVSAEARAHAYWGQFREYRCDMQALLDQPTESMSAEEKTAYGAALKVAHYKYQHAAEVWATEADHVDALRRTLVPDSLRTIAASVVDVEDCAFWTEEVQRWTQQIRTELGLDPVRTHFARSTNCPECGAFYAIAEREGERIRTPALEVHWEPPPDDGVHHEDRDWRVGSIACRRCGAQWWRGEPLAQLVDAMLASQYQETAAIGYEEKEE